MNEFLTKIASFSEREAICYKNRTFTYSELAKSIDFFYQIIAGSIPKGSVTILNSDLTFEGLALFFALHHNKCIIVPVTSDTEDMQTRAMHSGAGYILQPGGNSINVEILAPGKKIDLYREILEAEHGGLVLFSSGITGTPKGMVHDLDILMQPFLNKKVKSINFMALLMFDHIGGLNTVLSSVFSGALLSIPDKREPFSICETIEKYKVGVLPASPTFLNLILISGAYEKYDLSSLKVITYGTEPMPEGLLHKLNRIFPRVRFLQTFGTSETGISQITSKSSGSTKLRFDDPNIKYKIVDGELWIKSPTTIKGYLNAAMDQFTTDGWFKTGDLAEIDEEGYFLITGRKNEIINVGGLKVYPQEVESAIMEFEGIIDCLVKAESNPITGNIVIALIYAGKNTDNKTFVSSLRKFLITRLDRYKVPVKIRFVDNIEHNERFKKIRSI
jgi:acyl-coenzyme A synthetase/AMP-(fatty) acid ligase